MLVDLRYEMKTVFYRKRSLGVTCRNALFPNHFDDLWYMISYLNNVLFFASRWRSGWSTAGSWRMAFQYMAHSWAFQILFLVIQQEKKLSEATYEVSFLIRSWLLKRRTCVVALKLNCGAKQHCYWRAIKFKTIADIILSTHLAHSYSWLNQSLSFHLSVEFESATSSLYAEVEQRWYAFMLVCSSVWGQNC
jgi:hypothetical protein